MIEDETRPSLMNELVSWSKQNRFDVPPEWFEEILPELEITRRQVAFVRDNIRDDDVPANVFIPRRGA